jgi:spermidine synthase
MAWIIPIVYGSLGAFSLVFQTVLLREFFTVAAGNELSFAVALASWLFGVGAGSALGGYLNARPRRSDNPLPWLAAVLCILAPLLLAGVRLLQKLSAATPGTLIPLGRTLWLVSLLTIPFSFFCGFAFPQAAALDAGPGQSARQKMVRAYVWECVGALAAGLLYTFWLVEKSNPALTLALFSLPLLIAAAWIASRDGKKMVRAVSLLLLAANLFAVLAGGAARFDSWLVRERWLGLSTATWVESRDSRFQNLQLGLSHGQYCLYGNGQLAAVFPDDDAPRILAAQIITQHPLPRRVLIIGSGAGGLAGQLLSYPIEGLTTVEIDRDLHDLIVRHMPGAGKRDLEDPRWRRVVMDGRRFVMDAARSAGDRENRFDIVFLDQPDAWTAQINRYYTREFFLDLRSILVEDGVVALRLTSAENYVSEITSPYTATVYQTLNSIFPAIAVSPGPRIFIAAARERTSVSSDPGLLAERFRRLAPDPAGLQEIYRSLYPEQKTAFMQKALARYPVETLNTDRRPIAYFLYGRLLGWTSGSPLAFAYDFFEKVSFRGLFQAAALAFALVLACGWRRRKKGRGGHSLMLAAASGGFAGMAFEILAVFTFQNLFGHVYQSIGLLVASFMLGLGAGAFMADRWLEKNRPSRAKVLALLAGDQLFIALSALTCLPLLHGVARGGAGAGQAVLFAWLGSAGLLVGAILPLGLHGPGRGPAASRAGMLNAADYLGGTFGALGTASLLLPLYGSVNSLRLIAAAALASAALLLLEAGASRSGPATPSR